MCALQVAELVAQQQEDCAAVAELQDLKNELANARHSLEMSQSALRDGQLHQTQMVGGRAR
jgi:ribosomal protein L29